ncbi:MAG: hypothetical protein AAGE76_16620 [Pseudomonadota bacterium]
MTQASRRRRSPGSDRLCIALLPVFLFAACATDALRSTPTRDVGIGDDFQRLTVKWRRADAFTSFLYRSAERNGMLEVCGAIVTDGPNLFRKFETGLLQTTFMEAGDTLVANDLRFFNRLLPDETPQRAACAAIGTAWRPEWAANPPRVVVRRQQFDDP